MEISSSIPSTKHIKEEEGDIAAKNVERHSHTYGTAYYRLQSPRLSFDELATMSVNGIDKWVLHSSSVLGNKINS